MSDLIERARKFAYKKHKGQKYGEKDYFLYHVCSVADSLMNSLEKSNEDYDAIVASAFLHDVVEDTNTTLEEVEKEFGGCVANNVNALTKRKGESRKEYLKRVSKNTQAVIVKLHDSMCNATQSFSENDIDRFLKYLEYIKILGEYVKIRVEEN